MPSSKRPKVAASATQSTSGIGESPESDLLDLDVHNNKMKQLKKANQAEFVAASTCSSSSSHNQLVVVTGGGDNNDDTFADVDQGEPFIANVPASSSGNVAHTDNPNAVNNANGGGGNGLTATNRKRGFMKLRMQPTRVKRVMQANEDLGRMTSAVPAAVAAASERFLEQLLEASKTVMAQKGAKTLNMPHIHTAMEQTQPFRFLITALNEKEQTKSTKRRNKRTRDTVDG